MVAKRRRETDPPNSDRHENRSPIFDKDFAQLVAKGVAILVLGGLLGIGGFTAKEALSPSDVKDVKDAVKRIERMEDSFRVPPEDHAVLMEHKNNRDIHLNNHTLDKIATKEDVHNLYRRMERMEDLINQVLILQRKSNGSK